MNKIGKFNIKHKSSTELQPAYSDNQVKEMLDTWDIVNCVKCGKKISMLDGKMLKSGSGFVCNTDCD